MRKAKGLNSPVFSSCYIEGKVGIKFPAQKMANRANPIIIVSFH